MMYKDIVSLYPYVLFAKDYPLSQVDRWTGRQEKKEVREHEQKDRECHIKIHRC